jgi:hypothetical protein
MGAGMLDWGALLPPLHEASPPECGPTSPEMGEISPTWGKDNSIEGKCETAPQAALEDISPISPISPEEKCKRGGKSDTGGGGGQEDACARSENHGDLITCRQCQHLAIQCDPPACRIASLKPGALVRALPGYRPVLMPQRCAGFMALPSRRDGGAG